MAKPWADVAASPQFQQLAPADQEAARQQYFSQVVAPQVPSDQVDAARAQFDGATRIVPPAAVPQPTLTDRIASGMKSALAAIGGAGSALADSEASLTPGQDAVPTPPPPPSHATQLIDSLQPLPSDPPSWVPNRDEMSPGAQAKQDQAIADAKPNAARVAPSTANPYDTIPQGAVQSAFNQTTGQAGKTLASVTGAIGDLTGSDALHERASQFRQAASARIDRALQGNEDSDTTKTLAGVFSLAPLLAGAPAGMAEMVTQAGADGYGEARAAGHSPAEAVGRGTAMALANYVGMRVRVPGIVEGLTKAIQGAPASDAIGALAHAITTNVGGMEATTALADLYDKVAPGGLRPDMTAADLVHDLADTAKSATLLSLAVPGVPLGASHLFGAAHTLVHGRGDVSVAKAIDSTDAPPAPAPGAPPTAATAPAPAFDSSTITAAANGAPAAPLVPGINTLHNSIDEAAAKVGLMPKAAAALRDAVAKMDPQDAAAFTARAFHRFEANGLTSKAGAPGAFRDVLAQRLEAQQPEPVGAAPAAPATPAVEPEISKLGNLESSDAEDYSGLADTTPITPTAMAQANDIAAAAHQAATSPTNDGAPPTDAQKEAGNYKLGHVQLHGLDISIENPQGSVRSGVSPDGTAWSNEMQAHYGYIKGTHAGDGDHVDVFVGPNPESKTAFVIDQVDPNTGKFDEPKTILGANNEQEARELYAANYADGWNGIGAVTALPMDAFKSWVRDGVKSRPLGDISQWKPNDERAQPDVAEPSGVPAGAGDGGGGTAVAGGGDSRPDPAVAAGRGVGGDAAAPAGGTRAADAVGDRGVADASLTFKTAKGSVYQAHDDGTTTRTKAPRADIGHEGDEGLKDRSQATYYVNGEDATKLGEFQTKGGAGRRLAVHSDGRLGVQYTEGPSAGKFERRTMVEYGTKPNVGDTPVEVWKDGRIVHFGNPITEVSDPVGREAVPPPHLLGKPVTDYATPALEKIVSMKASSQRARDVASAEIARRGAVSDEPVLKQSTTEARAGVDPAALRSEVDRIQAGWKDAPPVHVVDDVAGLPRHIQDSLRSMGAEGKTRALLMPGKGSDPGDVYLIANRLHDVPMAQFALFHEVLGHYGIRKVLGTDAQYFSEMYRLRQANPKLAEEAEAWWQAHGRGAMADRMSRGMSQSAAMKIVRALSTEEALADRAGRGEPIRGLQSLMAKIQTWLRSVGLSSVADRLERITQAETAALLAHARSAVEGDGPHAFTEDGQPLLSQRDDTPADLPDAIIGHPLAAATTHPDYAAAKGGDPVAAHRLAEDLVTPEFVDSVRKSIGDKDVIVQGVNSIEASGRNKIPLAVAQVLADRLGAEATNDIAQSNAPKRTGMDGLDRLLNSPEFDGPVRTDKPYLLLDDTLTQGGTMAALASHIRQNGGEVAGEVALTGKDYSRKIALSPDLLGQVRDRYAAVEPDFRAATGYGFDALTESEARYLAKRGSPDVVRARIVEAGEQARRRADPEADRGAQEPLLSQHTPLEKEALERAGIAPRAPFKARVKGAYEKMIDALQQRGEIAHAFRQGAIDQFHGIDRAVKREFGNLPVEADPYITARLANGGTSSVMRALLLHGQAQWAANGQHLEHIDGTKGLLDILAPLGDDLNDFFGWMIGNRAARLMSEGREHNFTNDQIKALQGLASSSPEKLKSFQTAAKEYAGFKKSVLNLAEEAGIINPDSRAAWDNADHIPFYRQIDNKAAFSPTGKKGLSGQSSGVRALKGGTAALNDPMENLLMNFSRLVDASLKNNALRKTVDTLAGKTDVIEPVGYDMKGEVIPAGQIKKLLVDAGVSAQTLSTMPPKVFEGMAKMLAIKPPEAPDVVRVMVDGKPNFYQVHDPLLLKALTSFVPFDFPGLGVARAVKRLLTGTVTAEPAFMLRNFIRDTLASGMISRDGIHPGKSLAGIVSSYRELGGYEKMLFSGASFQSGNINGADPKGTAKALRRALREKGMNAASASHFVSTVVDTPAKLWEVYRHMGEAMENANREAVFSAAKRAGKSDTAAAFESKDLMDFSLRGSSPFYQLAADVLPFFNARVQGLYRLGRTDPKKLAKYGAVMSALSVGLGIVNNANPKYNALPDFDKDTYWHFFIGDKHFRVPKPFELGAAFSTIPERITRRIEGKDTNMKTAGRLLAAVRDQLAFDPVPQIFRPALDVATNTNSFTNAPIEKPADEGKLPTDRHSVHTSETVKQAVKAIRPIADKTGLSPERLEYLIDGYFGTAGIYALGLSDMVARKLDGAPAQPALRLDQLPIVKSFYREDPAQSTVYESDLYQLRQQLDQTYNSVKAMGREGDVVDAKKLRADTPELRAHDVIERAVSGQGDGVLSLSTLRKQETQIYNDRKMTPDEKRMRLDVIQSKRNAIVEKIMTRPDIRAMQ